MDYSKNVAALEQAVARHAFIRNIAYHRLPDGPPTSRATWNFGIVRWNPLSRHPSGRKAHRAGMTGTRCRANRTWCTFPPTQDMRTPPPSWWPTAAVSAGAPAAKAPMWHGIFIRQAKEEYFIFGTSL